MLTRKHFLVTGLILVIVALVVLSFRPRPIAVTTAQVTRGPLQVTVEEEGRTRVQERYVISVSVDGYAPRLALEVGDPVEAGQVLLRLRPVPPAMLDARSRAEAEARVARAQAALDAKQSQLRAVEASHELAQREYRRIQALFQDGKASQSELDRSQTEAERAAAALRSARYSVEVYRQELLAAQAVLRYSAVNEDPITAEQVPVTTPVTGRVLEVHHESEGIVTPGQPLLTVGDPHALEVAVDVLSADAVRIRPRMRVLLEHWEGDGRLEGRVRTVEPVGFTKISALGVEEQRVWVIVDIVSPRERWAQLGDGYRVEASFILWENEDVLQIPTSALFRYEDGWAVFVAEDGNARLRRVEIDQRSGLAAQIVAGLTHGETVITHPSDEVEDGTRVQVQQS